MDAEDHFDENQPSASLVVDGGQNMEGIKQENGDDPPPMTQSGSILADATVGSMYNRIRDLLRTAQIFPKPEDVSVNSAVKLPESAEPIFWCHIYYYELNGRVGEVYKSECRPDRQEVFVDGFCAPSDNTRFCLGVIGNVNRNPVVASVRKSIGKGMRLYQEDEDIYLECLSESAIFVQSPLNASRNGDHLATVYRLQANEMSKSSSICIFSRSHFDELMAHARTQGYNAVYALQTMCNVRVSFVKGWGREYRRQTITSTPCWVEVQFPRPLQSLDKMLAVLGDPNDEIHSFT